MDLLTLTAILAGISALGWVIAGIVILFDYFSYRELDERDEFDLFCPVCKEELPFYVKGRFCSKDGSELRQVPRPRCPNGHIVSKHDNFCADCGKEIRR